MKASDTQSNHRQPLRPFYESRKTDTDLRDPHHVQILKLLRHVAPRSVLDVGCGRGALLSAIAKEHPDARLVGLDISAGSAAEAAAKGLEVHVGDVHSGLPFENATFDCVVFAELIEHLVDPDSALREISRVLRAGGTLLLTTPNLASWFNRILLLFGVLPIFAETSLHANLGRHLGILGQGKATQGHLRLFTLPALREMLLANQYTIRHVRGCRFPRMTPMYAIDMILSRIPSLASNFVIAAERGPLSATIYRHVWDGERYYDIEISTETH